MGKHVRSRRQDTRPAVLRRGPLPHYSLKAVGKAPDGTGRASAGGLAGICSPPSLWSSWANSVAAPPDNGIVREIMEDLKEAKNKNAERSQSPKTTYSVLPFIGRGIYMDRK